MASVNISAIDTVLGMTGLALEKAGYSDALKLIEDNFAAECTVCGVKISGAGILSEQRQLLRQYTKAGVVLYRGPNALAWENLDENKCVKPGCTSTTYRLNWTDSETRHIFNSVLSRFETSFPLPEDIRNFSRVLKSDLISFQTSLSLDEITKFYREAFSMQGLVEDGLVTSMSKEHISLAFSGLPDERMVVVQAIDLGYKTDQDLRHVSLRTEQGPSLNG
jgi:hypothetical protein